MLRYRSRSVLRGISGGGGITPPFTPASIPGLTLWLDASDTATITQAGGNVSIWADKSGNAYNATQAVGVNQPITGTTTQNGLNTILSNIKSMILPAGLYSLPNGDLTVFISFRARVSNLTGWPLGGRVVDNSFGLLFRGTAGDNNYTFLSTSGSFGGVTIPGAGIVNTNPHIALYTKTTPTMTAWVDGANKVTNSSGGNQILLGLLIGANGSGSENINFEVYEILMYDSILSTSRLNQVNDYFSTKWAISVGVIT